MANTLEQVGAVTAMNLRNIPARWSSSLVAVLGIGGVTLVLIALLSIAAGFRVALEGSGSDDVAMILRSGSSNEMSSGFSTDQVTAITNAPKIARNAKNELLISPEVYAIVSVPLRGKTTTANMPLRGVGPIATQVRKNFRLVQGRMFTPGTNEVIVGNGVVAQYVGLEVGRTVRWMNADWTIVGRFTDNGGLAESEAWADAPIVRQARALQPGFQIVRVKLVEGAPLKAFKDELTKNPQLSVDVTSEKQFYIDQQKAMSTLINKIGLWIGAIMGLAALFAALNTLESAVASRVREIATLRAMGFGGGAVVLSVLIEAMILGAVGGLLGGLCAYIFLNGITSSTLNRASFSQITYAFTVTPWLMLIGIAYGLLLCLLAGILPGIRAANMPITTGLREL